MRMAALAILLALFCDSAAAQSSLNPAAGSARPPGISQEMVDAIADAVITRLRANPGILVDIVLSYEERIRSGRAMVQADDPVTGNPDGDVLAVEFWDPACEPCRGTAAALDEAASKDGRVKVVHKDLPTTQEAVESSLNSLASGHYADMRRLQTGGRPVPKAPDEARAKAADILQRNRDTAQRVKVESLPTIFIAAGGRVVRVTGAADANALLAKIAAARAAGQSAKSTTP